MTQCAHKDLEAVGEQKDDVGVNAYFRCRTCGDLLVVTPQQHVFSLGPMPQTA
jgi:hypothetical protein